MPSSCLSCSLHCLVKNNPTEERVTRWQARGHRSTICARRAPCLCPWVLTFRNSQNKCAVSGKKWTSQNWNEKKNYWSMNLRWKLNSTRANWILCVRCSQVCVCVRVCSKIPQTNHDSCNYCWNPRLLLVGIISVKTCFSDDNAGYKEEREVSFQRITSLEQQKEPLQKEAERAVELDQKLAASAAGILSQYIGLLLPCIGHFVHRASSWDSHTCKFTHKQIHPDV